MAANGDADAVDRLLSQPTLDTEAAAIFAVFTMLARDRPIEAISLGMAGGLSLPRPIPRDAILREAERTGLDGDALDDFAEAIMRIDDRYIEIEVKRAVDKVKADAKKR